MNHTRAQFLVADAEVFDSGITGGGGFEPSESRENSVTQARQPSSRGACRGNAMTSLTEAK